MSTTIAALIFLPLAPAAMGACYWWDRRKKARRLVAEVEVWMVVRHRG